MRTTAVGCAALLLVSITSLAQSKSPGGTKALTMKKLTPVLFVDEIEPCLKFWVERMGFEKTVEVPEGSKLGFVILVKDGVELMYQSRASLAKDMPALVKATEKAPSFLFLEVASLDDILPKLKGAGVEVVIPERKTFYGMREIGIREPGGHFVTFAAQIAAAPQK